MIVENVNYEECEIVIFDIETIGLGASDEIVQVNNTLLISHKFKIEIVLIFFAILDCCCKYK